MNYIISIINPGALDIMTHICKELNVPITLSLRGRGTATKSMQNLLGIESKEKRIVMNTATEELTASLIREFKRRLYIDAPGHGIIVSIPIKSIGGGKALSYFGGGQAKKTTPAINYDYELILAITNEGCTDMVMDAARAAGAGGGTVLHAKGTGAENAEKFFSVSIASEKEIVMIVSKASEKSAVMRSILENAGPSSTAGTIVFSLPVSEVAGFRLTAE